MTYSLMLAAAIVHSSAEDRALEGAAAGPSTIRVTEGTMHLEGVDPDAPNGDAATNPNAAPSTAHRLSLAAPHVAATPVVTGHEITRRVLRNPAQRAAPRGPDAVVGEFLEAFRILLRSS